MTNNFNCSDIKQLFLLHSYIWKRSNSGKKPSRDSLFLLVSTLSYFGLPLKYMMSGDLNYLKAFLLLTCLNIDAGCWLQSQLGLLAQHLHAASLGCLDFLTAWMAGFHWPGADKESSPPLGRWVWQKVFSKDNCNDYSYPTCCFYMWIWQSYLPWRGKIHVSSWILWAYKQ